MNEVLPTTKHWQFARYIYVNLRKKFPRAQFENILWRGSKATTKEHFSETMKEFKQINHDAFVHLMEKDLSTWSLAFFRVHHASCESVDNGY